MSKLLVDARLGWGSGIGRYARNTIPLVAARMPDVHFEILHSPHDADAVAEMRDGHANLSARASEIEPFSMREQLALPAIAREYDLCWFTNYWVPFAYRGRCIAAVHDMLHLESALFPASRVKRTLSRTTFAHLSRTADGLMFGSRFSEREFRKRFDFDGKSVVSGYGIDHAGWQLFDPVHIPAKQKQLLVVAASKFHKNFEIAVSAFTLADITQDWKLTIVTPDDKLRSSVDLERFHREGRVEFLKGLSNDELRDLYARTAILLMPSRYEGFGLPLAEGLQCGAWCISSTAESLVELGQGAAIDFVNPTDPEGWKLAIEAACRRLDAGPVDPAILSANMAHAAQYRWADTADRTVTLLKQVLPR